MDGTCLPIDIGVEREAETAGEVGEAVEGDEQKRRRGEEV